MQGFGHLYAICKSQNSQYELIKENVMSLLTNVILWIREPERMQDLKDSLTQLDGVTGFEVKMNQPYFVQVDYDYARTNSMKILFAARESNPATYIIGM